MAFLEEYTLLDQLGQGAFATVYKVRHNDLGYIRAIRVLNAIIAYGESDPTYQRFLDECRLLLRLGNGSHPNIVHIYQPRLKEQRALVEMDYVDGKDLFHYLKSKSQFVECDDVLRLVEEISSALAYCHYDIYKFCMDREEDNLRDDPNDGSQILLDEPTLHRLVQKYRIIHNDIHSANIIRRSNGSYVLLDFGLAIEGDDVVRSSRRKNGAPEYKAPEKWDNDALLSTQSDIYSFGVILYEFLAGRVPFIYDKTNSSPTIAEYEISKAHKTLKPEPIFDVRRQTFERLYPGHTYSKDYPDWLEDVIMKCLEKDPQKRYRDGKELYDDVQRHLSQNSASENELVEQVASLHAEVDKLVEEIKVLSEQPQVVVPQSPTSVKEVSPLPVEEEVKPAKPTPQPALTPQKPAKSNSRRGIVVVDNPYQEHTQVKDCSESSKKGLLRTGFICVAIAAVAGLILLSLYVAGVIFR